MSGAGRSRSWFHLGSRFLGSRANITSRHTHLDSILSATGQRNYIIANNNSALLEHSRCFLQTSSQDRIFKMFQSSNSQSNDSKQENQAEGEVPPQTNPEVAKLQTSLEELQTKFDDLTDKYRRSLAENDNMRKRLTKQIEDTKMFGIQSFCKDLLDVADVLNKAVEAGSGNESAVNKDMYEGLKLTHNQIMQVFRRHGVEQINPLNQKFDPNKHEALFQIPNPDVEPNIVLDVQKVGYQLHGRTIRPALVGVSRK